MKDFFISYNKADKSYALAIKSWLEDADYTTILQATDFHAGSNFVLEMNDAAKGAVRTIALLSPDYLVSAFTAPEWAAAFANDPTGKERKLVPVRIRECSPDGLLKAIVYIDLVGLNMSEAQELLILAIQGRNSIPSESAPTKKRASRKAPPKHEKPTSGVVQNANGKNIYQSAGSMYVGESRPIIKVDFVREPHHVTETQAAKIREKINKVGEQDEKAGKGPTYGSWMNKFKAHFELTTYKALPADRYDEAVTWLAQQKAIGRPSLRRTNNNEWKKGQYSAIWASAKKLGWNNEEVHQAAQRYFELKKSVASLKDLGEQRLEKFAAYMKRESRKRGKK